jgi:hypothetical protein
MRTKGERKTLQVTARVSRYTSSSGTDGLHLAVEDVASGLVIVSVDLPGNENMANFFTARSASGEAEVSRRGAELWGRKMEVKTVRIPVETPKNCKGYDDVASMACDEANKLNPGWEADEYCREWNGNHHKDGSFAITMRRWLTPPKIGKANADGITVEAILSHGEPGSKEWSPWCRRCYYVDIGKTNGMCAECKARPFEGTPARFICDSPVTRVVPESEGEGEDR